MSAIDQSNQRRDLYDQGMVYSCELPSIKEEFKNQILNEVEHATKKWSDWNNHRIAYQLIDIAYKKFGEMVREKYAHPQFNVFLEGSIRYQYRYFYNDLLNLVMEKVSAIHKD